MSDHNQKQNRFESLRQQAEELIQHQSEVPSRSNVDDLFHEMGVAYKELEIQAEELKRAQEELASLHRKYENLYEFAPSGYVTLNPEGAITKANLTAASLLNASKKSLLRWTLSNYIAAGWETVFLKARKQTAQTGNKQSVEFPLKTTSEPPVWVQADIVVQMDRHDSLLQYRVVLTDITERKRAEEALQQKSLVLKERVKELDCLYGLSRLLEQPGISRQELMQSAVELIPPAWQYPDMTCARLLLDGEAFKSPGFRETAWKQSADIVVNGNNAGRIEVFYLRQAPECVEGPFLREERELIDNVAERLGQYLEREQTKEALRRSESYYRAIFESSGTAMFIINEDTTIALANSNFEELSGYAREDIEGKKSWTEFMHSEDVPWMKEYHYLRRRDPKAAPRQYECRFIDGHGQKRDLLLSVDKIPETSQSIASGVELTERKRMEQSLRRERDISQRYLDTTQTTMVALNVEGRITMINQSGRELLGYAKEEIIGYNWFETCLPQPEGMDSVYPAFQSIMAGDLTSVEYFENNILCRDGTQRLMGWHNAFLEDDMGRVVGTLSSGEDITDRKQAEKRLQSAHDKLDTLVQLNVDGLMVLDQDGIILFVNPTGVEMLGREQDELLGEQFGHPLISGSDTEIELLSTSGDARVVELRGRETEWSGQTALLVSFRDITERKRAEERIYYLAYYDELTGLPNRRLVHDRLQKMTARPEHLGHGGAVFLVDTTRLREVNDTLGQQAGDELIMEVARRIGDVVGEEDTVARVSGGEFIVLSEGGSTADGARNLGKRILERMGWKLELSGRLVYPEVNIGFTLFPDRGTDPNTLIKQANIALNQAKKSAHSIQEFAGQDDWISRQFHLEHDLKQALTNEEFFLCYQTQIDLRTGRIVGLEALLRWEHPQRGIVSPGEFIPVLEHTGMIASVDAWVIHRVCKQLRSWQERGVSVKTSVNLSAQELSNDDTLEVVRAALEENGVRAENLEVEITETDLMENVDQASRILQTFADWGVRVALDDFGKGYSSLSYLQKLAINTIKIDKQFVDGLPENQDSVTLVQTIIAMAHNLGKSVLAEGVEREEQWQKLLELGCDYGQGFLWSRPQPVENLTLTGS